MIFKPAYVSEASGDKTAHKCGDYHLASWATSLAGRTSLAGKIAVELTCKGKRIGPWFITQRPKISYLMVAMVQFVLADLPDEPERSEVEARMVRLGSWLSDGSTKTKCDVDAHLARELRLCDLT